MFIQNNFHQAWRGKKVFGFCSTLARKRVFGRCLEMEERDLAWLYFLVVSFSLFWSLLPWVVCKRNSSNFFKPTVLQLVHFLVQQCLQITFAWKIVLSSAIKSFLVSQFTGRRLAKLCLLVSNTEKFIFYIVDVETLFAIRRNVFSGSGGFFLDMNVSFYCISYHRCG